MSGFIWLVCRGDGGVDMIEGNITSSVMKFRLKSGRRERIVARFLF